MRVLFISTPGIGHVFPMVPLAWALRADGHEVLVVTAGPALAVQRAGLAVVDAAPGFDRARVRGRIAQTPPQVRRRIQALRGRVLGDLGQAAEYLAVLSDLLVDAAVDVAMVWRPDLVIQSQVDGAGMLVASKFEIPLVTHGFGLARTTAMATIYRECMTDAFERHGVSDPCEPAATIDVAPASMAGHSAAAWPMRYVPYNGGGAPPFWALEQPDCPRVVVTLGTLEPQRGGLGVVRDIITAAEGLGIELVLALGTSDTSNLDTLPANVRGAGWIALHVLLPSCAGIVHHGGAGTTLTALDAGVPQLVLPSGADRYINANAVHKRGVGLRCEDDQIDAAALEQFLHDDTLRAEAKHVQAEMRDMPSPASLLPRLAALVR